MDGGTEGKREDGGPPQLRRASPASLLLMLPVAAIVYFAIWPEDVGAVLEGLRPGLPPAFAAVGPVVGSAAALAAAHYGIVRAKEKEDDGNGR